MLWDRFDAILAPTLPFRITTDGDGGVHLQMVGLPLVLHSECRAIHRWKGETLPYPTVYGTTLQLELVAH